MDATAESIMMEDLNQLAQAAIKMRKTVEAMNDHLALTQSQRYPNPIPAPTTTQEYIALYCVVRLRDGFS